MIPNDRRYLETHEWAKLDGDVVIVGITDYAVKHLTDLVFVDLPDVGDQLTQGERFGEIESVKAVSDLNAPVSGEVVEVNELLQDQLELIANAPFEEGWMIKVRMESSELPPEMLDAKAYESTIEQD
ncbi:MAG: glycine cleavage system protein GcvH [Planctomycetota bacterium]